VRAASCELLALSLIFQNKIDYLSKREVNASPFYWLFVSWPLLKEAIKPLIDKLTANSQLPAA
jgi:hypothetical protein